MSLCSLKLLLTLIHSVELVNHTIDESAIENDIHSTGAFEISLNAIRLTVLNWL